MLSKYRDNPKKIRILLSAIFALLILLMPLYFTNLYYLRVVEMIAIFTLLGLGLNFLFGYTGQISLGHAAFYALGAYVSSILETKYNVHFLVAWVLALTFTGIIAFIISFPILKLKGHYLAMATLAFGLIIQTFLVQWTPLTGGHDGITIMTNAVLGQLLVDNLYYLIVGSVILVFCLIRNITKSSVGRAHQALRDDEDAAEALGIPVKKHKIYAFILSAILASLAGIWYAHLSMVITPEVFSLGTSVQILMMVVVGGLASNVGAVLGAAFIIALPEFLYGFQEANNFIFGIIVLLVLVFFPKGLNGIYNSLISLLKGLIVKPSEKTVRKDGVTNVT
jgi:branched-chain amino acid transport system permease protein